MHQRIHPRELLNHLSLIIIMSPFDLGNVKWQKVAESVLESSGDELALLIGIRRFLHVVTLAKGSYVLQKINIA